MALKEGLSEHKEFIEDQRPKQKVSSVINYTSR